MGSLIRGDSSMTERLLGWLEPRENEMAELFVRAGERAHGKTRRAEIIKRARPC